MDTPRRLELTSIWDLKFRGVVEIRETEDHCIYSLPEIGLKMTPSADRLKRFNMELHARNFHLRGVGQTLLFEELRELNIILSEVGVEYLARDIEFKIPKALVREAKYLKFSVQGRFVITHYHDAWVNLHAKRFDHAVAWPLTAEANILDDGSRHIPPHLRGEIIPTKVWREPDPNDCCSAAKIH